MVDDLAHVAAALDLVFDLAEDLPDLVLDGVRPAGLLLEAVQVGKELAVDEIAQVVAGRRLVVVDLPKGSGRTIRRRQVGLFRVQKRLSVKGE